MITLRGLHLLGCIPRVFPTTITATRCSALKKVHRTRPPSSWIAPSWVHSTCLRTTSTATRCSALQKVHRTKPISSWIAPSWVHSTCRSNTHHRNQVHTQHRNQVQRTGGSAPHQTPLFVDCTFLGAFHVSFEQTTPQPGAAHRRKRTAPDSPLRGLHLLRCIPRVLRTTSTATRCSALEEVHRTRFPSTIPHTGNTTPHDH
jgi:hypothetical protein